MSSKIRMHQPGFRLWKIRSGCAELPPTRLGSIVTPGGAGVLLFFIVIILVVGTFQSGPARAIDDLSNFLFHDTSTSRMTSFGIAGAISLVVGQILCSRAKAQAAMDSQTKPD